MTRQENNQPNADVFQRAAFSAPKDHALSYALKRRHHGSARQFLTTRAWYPNQESLIPDPGGLSDTPASSPLPRAASGTGQVGFLPVLGTPKQQSTNNVRTQRLLGTRRSQSGSALLEGFTERGQQQIAEDFINTGFTLKKAVLHSVPSVKDNSNSSSVPNDSVSEGGGSTSRSKPMTARDFRATFARLKQAQAQLNAPPKKGKTLSPSSSVSSDSTETSGSNDSNGEDGSNPRSILKNRHTRSSVKRPKIGSDSGDTSVRNSSKATLRRSKSDIGFSNASSYHDVNTGTSQREKSSDGKRSLKNKKEKVASKLLRANLSLSDYTAIQIDVPETVKTVASVDVAGDVAMEVDEADDSSNEKLAVPPIDSSIAQTGKPRRTVRFSMIENQVHEYVPSEFCF